MPVTATVMPAAATEFVSGIVGVIAVTAMPIDSTSAPIVADGVMVVMVLKNLVLVVVDALAGPVTVSVIVCPSGSVPRIVNVMPARVAWAGDVSVT